MLTNKIDYLNKSELLDFYHASISELIASRKWLKLSEFDRIGAAYNFVRNEIKFGYNASDDIKASQVLADGYGQCNTKGTLLMALFRALEIPCRLHGFTIHKSLQRGVVPELIYPITPENILHSWVEVWFEDNWINLEGFILDDAYLAQLKSTFLPAGERLCSYGAGTDDLANPEVNWSGNSTYIQKSGINQDFGVFQTPDQLYLLHQQEFSQWKKYLFSFLLRHWMNKRVERIRKHGLSGFGLFKKTDIKNKVF